MISVIVASDRPGNFHSIRESIALTIGVDYEIVHITELERGLCAAYNSGAARAKYEMLCFVHDDVLFHTEGWGSKVVSYLEDRETGVIGVMGGCYKSAYGLTWRDGETAMHRYHVKDGLENGKRLLSNPLQEQKSRVLCIDGAFLCCRKPLWDRFHFDENIFKGFHFYDADFCMQAAQEHKNYVVYDILIEHFSQGRIDRSFLECSFDFERKWAAQLPASVFPSSRAETARREGYSLAGKLEQLKRTGFDRRQRWQLIREYFKEYNNLYHLIRSSYFGMIKKH